MEDTNEKGIGRVEGIDDDSTPVEINVPKYWDKVYEYEHKNRLDTRRDVLRWNLILNEIGDGLRVMDYGCGMGDFLRYTRPIRANCRLFGCDFSPYAIEQATKLAPAITYVTDVSELSDYQRTGYFEVVTCQHVVEHLEDPLPFCEKLRGLVKKGGLLILALPINDDEWREHHKVWQVQDAIELCQALNYKTAKFVHRTHTRVIKKDGSRVQEMIAFMVF